MGVDLRPIIHDAHIGYSISEYLLLACAKAESGLNPLAARYGTWPDVSFGLTQQTVSTAGGYGVGNGSNTPSNIAFVRDKLFDRRTSLYLGARILAGCLDRAAGQRDPDLQALIAYNSGSIHPEGDWYWRNYGSNIASYRLALQWAKGVLGV